MLPEIAALLINRPNRKVGFISAAEAVDPVEEYFARMRGALNRTNIDALHIRYDAEDRMHLLDDVGAIMVGGGNTWALLKRLHEFGLFERIRARVCNEGVLYIAASAGMNVAGLKIIPTNDWNIVEYGGPYDGFGFIPCSVNPHFMESFGSAAPNREPTSERIRQFQCYHPHPVLGIEEGATVIVQNGAAHVNSHAGNAVHWFEPGKPDVVYPHGSTIPMRFEPIKPAPHRAEEPQPA